MLMSLEDLRKNLSAVDRQIVALIAERHHIVSEVGRRKQTTGAATRDYAREKDVIDMGRSQAKQLGVDPELIENILAALIQSSLASQERDRVIAKGKGDGNGGPACGAACSMVPLFCFGTWEITGTALSDVRDFLSGSRNALWGSGAIL